MSSPNIEEITLRLAFAPDGTVSRVHYVDQEGCGWEDRAGCVPSTALTHVISTHLRHCANSHDVHQKIMCGYTVKADIGTSIKGAVLHCTLEKHASGDHVFMVGTGID